MRLTLRASAKINLDLRIGARRPDGYHDLQTVLQTLDLHDTVTIESRRGPFALDGDAALMPLDETNLVWRAAAALWRAAGKSGDPRGVRVRVTKRIPSRAGLGGGSSDAAAALVGPEPSVAPSSHTRRLDAGRRDARIRRALLSRRRHGAWPGPRRAALSPGEPAATPCRHRAARLWSVHARRLPLAGRGPGVAALHRGSPELRHPGPCDPEGWRNDLEGPVERRHPAIGAIRRRLAAAGAELARMSGSGSAVFGLFATEPAAASRGCRPGARGPSGGADQDAPAKLGRKSPAGLTPRSRQACRPRRRSSTIKVLHGRGGPLQQVSFSL